jgi:hypothetical protein
MSREEHLRELVRQGQALRQEDIDLGAKQERERIIELLEDECKGDWPKVIEMSLSNLIALINGEQ